MDNRPNYTNQSPMNNARPDYYANAYQRPVMAQNPPFQQAQSSPYQQVQTYTNPYINAYVQNQQALAQQSVNTASQAAFQQSGIRGRMVNHPGEIVPGETPMDGIPSFFPTVDLSCIYVKRWNENGELVPTRYILEQPATQEVDRSESNPWEEIQQRLTNIETAIASLAKPARSAAAKKGETAE